MGDVMLGRGVAERLTQVPPGELWSAELHELCRSCDLIVCNLECSISDRGEPTRRLPGKQFFFRGPPGGVESLEAIRVGAVGLANNHALDYEEDALLDTLELLEEAGIASTGAGVDVTAARRGAILDLGGTRVGLLAVSDHPAEYAAGLPSPGIAHAQLSRSLPDWLTTELRRLRAMADLVIVSAHWGPNMNPDTARWQRRAAAAMVAAGASLVAGHSAHVFHGVGWEGTVPLLFDLGDALDDYAVDPRLRNDLGILALWRPSDPQPALELVGLGLEFCRTGLA